LTVKNNPLNQLFIKGKIAHVLFLFIILSLTLTYLKIDFWQQFLITIFLVLIYTLVLTALFALENPSYFIEKPETKQEQGEEKNG